EVEASWPMKQGTHNESLTDYVLISQTQPLIEHFQRRPDGQWPVTEVRGLEGELYITSITCRLKLAEIYDHVGFQSPKSLENANS
ncbi:MAG TPA: hypothetical protein PKC13_27570, partial [Blastocatellia bacterium]|nr:hypothetical protein [Blastocatellia bacterium]